MYAQKLRNRVRDQGHDTACMYRAGRKKDAQEQVITRHEPPLSKEGVVVVVFFFTPLHIYI